MATTFRNIVINADIFKNSSDYYNYQLILGIEKETFKSKYEKRVLAILLDIEKTQTGTILLKAMEDSKRTATIIPLDPVDYNAYAGFEQNSKFDGISKTCHSVSNYDSWEGSISCIGVRIIEKSIEIKGIDTKIWFLPETFDLGIATSYSSSIGLCLTNTTVNYKISPGASSDEMLFHELCHAYRRMIGRGTLVSMGDGYGTEDEFSSILIANIYASELGRQIRKNHEGFEVQELNANQYYNTYKDQLERLNKSMPDLCKDLATVKCDFNPLKVFVKS